MKKKTLLTSIMTIVLCVSIIAGSTFALFTSTSEVNIAVTAGKVEMTAYLDDTSLELYSIDKPMGSEVFENGGTADLTAEKLTLTNVTPGDKATFDIVVTNSSNVAIQYRVTWASEGELMDALDVSVNGESYKDGTSEWAEWTVPANDDDATKIINVSVELPLEVTDTYQTEEADISFKVEAVQANGTEYFGKTLVTDAASLAAALEKGGEVVLLNDIAFAADDMVTDVASIPVALAITKDTVIDLNGHDITLADTGDEPTAVIFAHDADLTINGEGTVSQLGTSDYVIWGKGASTVTINGGTYYAAGVETTLLYASGNTKYDPTDDYATIIVNGGTFLSEEPSDDAQDYLNVMNHGVGRITLYGGVYDFDPDWLKTSWPNGTDDKNYITVAEGYKVTELNGLYYVAKGIAVDEADDLQSTVAAGGDVLFADDITTEETVGNSYGKSGLVMTNGSTIDGGGNTLTVENANGTWDCGIYTSGGTIQNITVGGAFRGIFVGGALTSDLVLNNVVIDNVCYTFHTDGSTSDKNEYKVVINDSTLNGWTSYSDCVSKVEFNNCNFGKGTGGYQYAFMRPYAATVLTNCVFEEGFEFDATKNGNIVFDNCYVGSTLITADNITELLGADAANAIVK